MSRTVFTESWYKRLTQRLNWNQFIAEEEAEHVVKGLSRKVIIVKSPDPKIFEQAIFIVRDDYLSNQGIGQKELLRQARAAANGYVGSVSGWRHRLRLTPLTVALLGAGGAGVLWGVLRLCGVF